MVASPLREKFRQRGRRGEDDVDDTSLEQPANGTSPRPSAAAAAAAAAASIEYCDNASSPFLQSKPGRRPTYTQAKEEAQAISEYAQTLELAPVSDAPAAAPTDAPAATPTAAYIGTPKRGCIRLPPSVEVPPPVDPSTPLWGVETWLVPGKWKGGQYRGVSSDATPSAKSSSPKVALSRREVSTAIAPLEGEDLDALLSELKEESDALAATVTQHEALGRHRCKRLLLLIICFLGGILVHFLLSDEDAKVTLQQFLSIVYPPLLISPRPSAPPPPMPFAVVLRRYDQKYEQVSNRFSVALVTLVLLLMIICCLSGYLIHTYLWKTLLNAASPPPPYQEALALGLRLEMKRTASREASPTNDLLMMQQASEAWMGAVPQEQGAVSPHRGGRAAASPASPSSRKRETAGGRVAVSRASPAVPSPRPREAGGTDSRTPRSPAVGPRAARMGIIPPPSRPVKESGSTPRSRTIPVPQHGRSLCFGT